MRIVHVYWSLTYGGVETMLVNIANAQAAAGNAVAVVIINNFYEPALAARLSASVALLSMGRRRHSRSPLFLYRLTATLHRLQPDVLHLHSSSLYGFLLRRRWRRRACCTLHALPYGALRATRRLRRIALWQAIHAAGNVCLIDRVPRVFAISAAVQEALRKGYGVASSVVSNGIVTRAFLPRGSAPPGETFKIVQVSRLEHDKKGQDLLLHAIALLADPAVQVDFIGAGASLPYLQTLAAELGVAAQVRFLGARHQEEIAALLAGYDLFVQPSRREGFGLTVAEALAAALPVIVSSGQGPAEVCCGSTYGWVFANGSAAALAQQIALIREDYAAALRKAAQARQYVIATYDVAQTAHRYLAHYAQ